MINKRLGATVGTFLSGGLHAVGYILFQGPLHAVFPRIDVGGVEFQSADKLQHLVDGHAVAEHTGDELGIVPEFRIELLAETLDRGLVAALVDELEVIAFAARLP